MKKSMAILFALVFVLGLSSTVFAAVSSFEDVPANHWAYDSVAKLAQAGLVDGYRDGTFRGSKTITRYEMATIVANAMTKEDKADDALKIEIRKLKTEFSKELDQLSVRMTNAENRLSATEKIQFKIAARQIYEHAKNPAGNNNPVDLYYHYRFFMTTNLDPNAQFISMWESSDDMNTNASTTSQGGNFTAKQAYLRAKIGNTVVNAGRQPFSWLGNGLVCDNSGKWDGLTVELGSGSKFTVRTGAAQRYMGASNIGGVNVLGGVRTFYMANAKYTVNPNLNFISVYLKDQGVRGQEHSTVYDSASLGFNYTFGNVMLTSEYGKNQAVGAKAANHQQAPKGMYTEVKYKNADQSKIGTWDLKVGYRKAEAGFDFAGLSTLDNLKNWGLASGANDVQGLHLIYEFVPFKNVVTSLRGYDLKGNSNNNLKYRGYVLRLDYNY